MASTLEMRRSARRHGRRHLVDFVVACSIVIIVSVSVILIFPSLASAQQMPVPAPDALEKWAAAQDRAQRTDKASLGGSTAPQFSFVRAPKHGDASNSVGFGSGVAGVALGGKGSAPGNAGAATRARASFVGLGDPLPPGIAKRWKDGPSVPIDIDTEEVMEFDPSADPVGPPIDEEEREREEEEEEERERAEMKEKEKEEGQGKGPAARKARREKERREKKEKQQRRPGEEAEEEEQEEGFGGGFKDDEKEREREREKEKFAAEERLAASFVSFASGRAAAAAAGNNGGGSNGGNKPVSGLSVVAGPKGPWEPRKASAAVSDVPASKRAARASASAAPRANDAAAGAEAPSSSSSSPSSLAESPSPSIKPPARIPGILADVFGLNATDNAAVNGKLTEPPDLALCVGGSGENGKPRFLLQAVNSAWAVYDASSGDLLAGPFSLYSLFKVPRNSSMTDPGCVFDHSGSKRFFLTIQWYSRSLGFAYQVIVVSRTSDPREGFNGVYYVDTSGTAPALGLRNCAIPGGGAFAAVSTSANAPSTNDASSSSPSSPPPPPSSPNSNVTGCLGDYPSYGVDRHALWFGVNHYTFATGRLQGAALYGVRKADLLDPKGAAFPRVAVFTAWGGGGDGSNSAPSSSSSSDNSTTSANSSPPPLRLGFTLQPATPSAGEPFDDRRGGTQYVLASSYFFRTGLPSVVAWAITNTSLIDKGLPNGQAPTLSPAVVLPALPLRKPAKVFSGGLRQEAAVVAAASARAAAAASNAGGGVGANSAAALSDEGAGGAGAGGNKSENDFDVQRLDEKDERLQQVTLSGGSLWTNMQTAVEVIDEEDKGEQQGDDEKGKENNDGGERRRQPQRNNKKKEPPSGAKSKTVSGIAYFRVEPRWSSSGTFEPIVAQNGYVAVPGHHCVNGAVAASPRAFSESGGEEKGKKNKNNDNKSNNNNAVAAAMAFSILGPEFNYSAAFVAIRPEGPGKVVVPRPSQAPLHGFSPRAMRNGDYTGATASADGSLWLGAQQASSAVHVTSSGKRQNWETVLVRVDPARMP